MSASIPPSTLEKFTTFGDLLRFLRRRMGITQTELSIAVGYSTGQISRLEQNLRLPDIPTIEALFVPALGLEDETKAVARLLELAANVRREDAPALGLCPYKGLSYFDEADADLFVGREALTAKLVERVLALTSNGQSKNTRFLAVVGASGSGKSSLVRAGLVPALRWNKVSADWHIHILTPTVHPLESLAASLTRESDSVTAATTLLDDLARSPRSLQFFVNHKLGSKTGSRLLLVADQFEELFALCRSEEERGAFIDNLLTASSEADGSTVVVITLRADFYAHCAGYVRLREALAQNQEYIGAMNAEELRRVIEEPAHRGRWELEPGLVDLLLHDVGHEPGALPLLSHALFETWQRRRGRTLTLSGYASSGGVRGAIAETAETVFTDQFTREQQVIARRIFLRLTELSDESSTADTRRRATFDELILRPDEAAATHAVLKALADARLITTSEGSAEVAHEALIREWPTLRGWLEDNREGLRLHRHLTEAAQEWELLEHEPGAFYRGARLARASEWASTNEQQLNELERAFLQASLAQAQREEAEREAQRRRELEAAQKLTETQRRGNSRLRRRAVYLAGALVLAIALAGVALFFGEQARANALSSQASARLATSRELAAAAVNNLEVDPERSILLALQAESTNDTFEARNALHRSILASRVEHVLKHDAQVWSVNYSPDGKRVATASQDKTAKIWDAATGQLLLTLTGHTKSVNGVVFSPDQKRIATTSDDHTAKVWDAETGKELFTLTGHTMPVYRIAFTADGSRLVTTSADGTIKVWDANTGKELNTLHPSHAGYVEGLGMSPDGNRIVACEPAFRGGDRIVDVWDLTSGKEVLTLPFDPGQWDCQVAYSPDGKRIAVASDGLHYARVWDANTGQELLSGNFGHSDWLRTIAFSPDGKLAATGGADNKVNIWDTTSGQVLITLAGHNNGVNGVAFSPDGKYVASASWDRTARIWNITPARESLFIPMDSNWSWNVKYNPDGTRLLTDEPATNSAEVWDPISGEGVLTLTGLSDQPIHHIAYSPDGKLIAGGGDRAIIVWDAQTGQQRITLSGHTNYSSIAFSPDGIHLASSSGTASGGGWGTDSGKAIIWDLASGQALFTLQASNTEALSVAYSPDGRYLLTGTRDGKAIVWDAATGTQLGTLLTNTELRTVAYSPDEQHVATSGMGGAIKLWDVPSEKLLLTLKGHTGIVNSVTYSPDGKLLASAGGDGTARVWDAVTGVNLLTLPVDNHGAGGVSFSPDGTRLAVGGASGVQVFILPIDEVVALAKSRVTRTLTTEECQTYLHVATCPAAP